MNFHTSNHSEGIILLTRFIRFLVFSTVLTASSLRTTKESETEITLHWQEQKIRPAQEATATVQGYSGVR
jgi:hypothetical protein